MDPEFDPSLCPTCFFHTSLSPYPSTDLHLPLPVLVQLPIFPACLTCPPCTFSDDDKRCGHAARLLQEWGGWRWWWLAHGVAMGSTLLHSFGAWAVQRRWFWVQQKQVVAINDNCMRQVATWRCTGLCWARCAEWASYIFFLFCEIGNTGL